MIVEGKVDYFVDTVFNYPTLAECYKPPRSTVEQALEVVVERYTG